MVPQFLIDKASEDYFLLKMMSTTTIILEYVCPTLGCIMGNIMFAGMWGLNAKRTGAADAAKQSRHEKRESTALPTRGYHPSAIYPSSCHASSSLQICTGIRGSRIFGRVESHPLGLHDRKYNWMDDIQFSASSELQNASTSHCCGLLPVTFLSRMESHDVLSTTYYSIRIFFFSLPMHLVFCFQCGSIFVRQNFSTKTIMPRKSDNLLFGI